MADSKQIEVTENGDVTVVRFNERRIIDQMIIQEIGTSLFDLVDVQNKKKILLNFDTVDFLSSAALGKLITLNKKVKTADAVLKLCSIRPEIYEVFALTRLNQLFDIRADEADALTAFGDG